MASYIREDATFLGTKNSAESDSSAESLFAPCSSKERDGRKGTAAPRSQPGRGRREWGTSGRRSLKLKKKKKKEGKKKKDGIFTAIHTQFGGSGRLSPPGYGQEGLVELSSEDWERRRASGPMLESASEEVGKSLYQPATALERSSSSRTI